jgi:hypothetical protein
MWNVFDSGGTLIFARAPCQWDCIHPYDRHERVKPCVVYNLDSDEPDRIRGRIEDQGIETLHVADRGPRKICRYMWMWRVS